MMYESYPVVDFTTTGGIEKDTWIDNILDIINEMEVEDYIVVYDFGKNGNCKLYIYLDDDYDIKIETDIWENPDDPDDGRLEFVDSEYIAQDDTNGMKEKLYQLWNEEFGGVD